MVDNFNKIKPLLSFRSKDDFYFVQVIQRKKDHKEGLKVTGANNNARLIKMYTVGSIEYLDKVETEIKELCNLFNARAGINLNRRSYEQCSLQALRKVTDQILNKDFEHTLKAYSSVCGTYNNENDKRWILDIDDKDFKMKPIIDMINTCQPEGNKFVQRIETKNGYHIISKPFNVEQFRQHQKTFVGDLNIDIHKDNPVNLYIP